MDPSTMVPEEENPSQLSQVAASNDDIEAPISPPVLEPAKNWTPSGKCINSPPAHRGGAISYEHPRHNLANQKCKSTASKRLRLNV